jgi:HPt (histidine-containing phosphotransfer) domain-containing protein
MSKTNSEQSTTSQTNTMAKPTAINLTIWEELREDLGGNIDMLTRKFLQRLDSRTESIFAAISANDSELLGNEAHKLKGASATIGAELLSKLCQQLEQSGKKDDFASAVELKETLLAEAMRVRHSLENIINGGNYSPPNLFCQPKPSEWQSKG